MSLKSEDKLEFKAPAKINLYLYITGKLDNGYHTLETLMAPVSIYDEISLWFNNSGEISFHPESSKLIPCNEKNIAWKAADLFYKRINKKAGLEIKIKKNIPVEAGLGGGSSDGAKVLSRLNEYHGEPLTIKELEQMASGLGADVPFFIKNRTAHCSGIGDIMEPVEKITGKNLIIVNPGKGLSTAEVYKKLNFGLTNCVKKNKRLLFKDCWESKNGFQNDLETVSETLMPEIAEIKKKLIEAGAEISMMSGSGPTCFGLFGNSKKRDQALESFLKNCNPAWRVFSAEFI